MKKIFFLILFVLLNKANAHSTRIPDCISQDINQDPGFYSVRFDANSKSSDQIVDFIAELTHDPIWSDGVTVSGLVSPSGKKRTLEAIVKPNLHRFPKGTTIEQTRTPVELQIKKLISLGAIVICPNPGE